jgi:16S rRNA (uracil1498-N3)-methyltransferase
MTRRRWIADTWTATTATLTGDQADHLARVLRAEPGQIFDVVAGGFLHRAEVTSVREQEVLFALHEELESDAALPLHLLLAVFKFDHMEWAIEKATELGVSCITPILARRTEKHLALAAPKRTERWRRIALEAAKQSRRTDIPEIADPIQLKPALDQEKSPLRILLSETEQATTLTAALTTSIERAATDPPTTNDSQTTCALAIGPEGGWTPEEMSLFTLHQWQHVTLGPRILRAETAAIAAIAIASTHLL